MLVLDSGIRDWVLLPIFVVMLLVGIARSNMMQLIRSDTTVDFDRLKHECVAAPRWPPDACDRRRRSEWGSQLLGRSARVRGSGGVLSADAYATRRHFMVNALNPKDVKSGGANMMAQTNVMQNMMKGNVTMMIPNVLIMGWVTYFFSGFVLVKLPFPLTSRFKVMLQRGIALTTLDTSYVSSLSWYILLMFGMRGLFSLLMGQDSVVDETKVMQAQMGMGAAAGPQQFDAKGAYRRERDSLKLAPHVSTLEAAEQRLLLAHGL